MFEVIGISKSYHDHPVLHPVSFRVGPGECVGVSGVNGSGKSTLLRILAQVEKPDGGSILYRDRDVRGDKAFIRFRLGYVPQNNELAEELTVAQQISLWQAACDRRGGLGEEIVALMGLEELMPRRIGELSGGMQRRVSIALALSGKPEILVMDEATSALDETYRIALLDWLEGYLRRGGRLVWCSHWEEEFQRLCQRRLIIREGRADWLE